MSKISLAVITSLLQKLPDFKAVNKTTTIDPLLNATDINQLMATAGRLKNISGLTSNRFTQSGEQPSTVTGSGLDFADRRHYVAGDDPRYIDWKASARSQQTLIRNYYTELTATGCIVIDRRPNMSFGTRKQLKVTQAVQAGISLGAGLLSGGYQLACLLLDNPNYWQPAQCSRSQFRQTATIAARACPPGNPQELTTSWVSISDCLKNRLPQGSRLILISDFLQLDEADYKALQQLKMHSDLTIIQVIDPLELGLPELQPLTLLYKNCTTQQLDNPQSSRLFNQFLQERFQQQAEQFKKLGCQFIRLQTDQGLDALKGIL